MWNPDLLCGEPRPGPPALPILEGSTTTVTPFFGVRCVFDNTYASFDFEDFSHSVPPSFGAEGWRSSTPLLLSLNPRRSLCPLPLLSSGASSAARLAFVPSPFDHSVLTGSRVAHLNKLRALRLLRYLLRYYSALPTLRSSLL